MTRIKQYKLRQCGNRGYMVTLPRELIEDLGWDLENALDIIRDDKKIVIQKAKK